MWLPRGGREWGRTLPSHGYQWEEASGTPSNPVLEAKGKMTGTFSRGLQEGVAREMDSGSPFWNVKWDSFRYCNSALLCGGLGRGVISRDENQGLKHDK